MEEARGGSNPLIRTAALSSRSVVSSCVNRFACLALAALLLAAAGGAEVRARAARDAGSEVVVRLAAPPLALAPRGAARVARQQASFRAALAERLPEARVRWRYRLVVDGLAVVLPARAVSELRTLPHVRGVYESGPYAPAEEQSPAEIGAPALWGSQLTTAGQGVKIGIIDSGVDEHHPYFAPADFAMPAGFPKGQPAYTTPKVIVARSFPPPGVPPASTAPFARSDSSHGTHVAGIAAGDAATPASGGRVVSGIAPKAYIGNYKVFFPTRSGLSPNANAPEIVAAIEAAVHDGMNVVNFSGGESEIEPSRDIVARALDAAAAAGVVPVVAAGNSYEEDGAGSVSSPASAQDAVAVAAAGFEGTRSYHADFSSVGPTPLSLRLKPDVAAPGVNVVSSVPGGWGSVSGTSMASPHVAGAAALLLQRHPGWTVAQVKSALVETGVGVRLAPTRPALAGPQFVGGGLVSLPGADDPLIFTSPSSLSFGLRPPGSGTTRPVQLTDAGGGTGTWQVSLDQSSAPAGAQLVVPATVDVPGTLSVGLSVSASGSEGDLSGYIALRHGTDVRRIPFWGLVSAPALGKHTPIPLSRVGLHRGTTRGEPSLVSGYRYPEDPRGLGVHVRLAGPEVVYRVVLRKPVANFGVVVTRRSRGVAVEPRVVAGLDEDELQGDTALPVVQNPYLPQLGAPVLVAGALLPTPGQYGVVFDSPTMAGAGLFAFRYWVNDVTPPTVRLRTRTVAAETPVLLAVRDGGSGVYPASLSVSLDGHGVRARYANGTARVSTAGLEPGRHRLRLRVSDYEETRNDENVGPILPNTRFFTAWITIRR